MSEHGRTCPLHHFFHGEHLVGTAKNRTSRGEKLSPIMCVDPGGREEMREVVKLQEHVTRGIKD